MAGPVRIAILANAKPAVQSMHKVEESADRMGKKMGGVGKGIAAGMAVAGGAVAAGLAVGFKQAIDQAASLSAAVGTTKSIFKDASGDMLAWSKTAATTLGLSQSEALNATKVFGGFFTGVGMGTKEAATMSKNWTTMAANMSAFGDIPVSESLDAVKSALIGEYDPIQKLIPTISAASLQQKAMELSGKKNAKALSDQDKAAALNAIMMESMANKVGAAERKQQGYAVQMDILKAQMKDAAAVIGGPFLKAITKGMAFVNTTAIPAVKNLAGKYGPKLAEFFAGLKSFTPPKAIVDIATSEQVTSILDNAKQGFLSLQPAFSAAFGQIMPILRQVAATFSTAFSKAVPQIKAIFGTVATIVRQAFELVRAATAVVVGVITALWRKFGANILSYLSKAFAAVVGVLQGAFTIIKGIFDVVIGLLTGDWSRAWNGVRTIVSGVGKFLVSTFNLIKAQIVLLGQIVKGTLSAAWNAAKSATAAAWSAIKSAVQSGIDGAVSAVAGLGGRVRGALSDAAGWLVDTGRNIVQGMLNGIGQMGDAIVTAARNIGRRFIDEITSVFDMGSPSKVMAKLAAFVMDGFIGGLVASTDRMQAALGKLTKLVKDAFTGKVEAGWLKRIGADTKALKGLLDRRAKVLQTAAQRAAKLNDLIEARAGVVADVAGTIRGGFQLVDEAAQDGNTSMRAILHRGNQAVQQAQQFAANLAALKARGVAADVLQEMAQAGPQAGAATARAFLGASRAQIDAVNANYRALAKAGQQAGGVVGDALYLSGIRSSQAFINGLRATEAALNRQIQAIATGLDTALRKALKLKPGKPITLPTTIGRQTLTAPTAVTRPRATAATQKPTVVVNVNAGAILQNDRQLADTIVNAINSTAGTLGRPYALNVVTG